MKKKILILFIGLFFIGCGEEFPYTSTSEKKKNIRAEVEYEKDFYNQKKIEAADKAIRERKKILDELEIRASKGDKKAYQEIEKWQEIFNEVYFE